MKAFGKFVRVAFAGHNPQTGAATREHMWVKVIRVSEETFVSSNYEMTVPVLVGKLDNEPLYVAEPYVQLGDTVRVRPEQIEEVSE